MEATSIEALIERLAHENPRWRAEAEARLVSLGEAAVVPLKVALRSPVVSVRVHAAQALGRLNHVFRARAYAGPAPEYAQAPVMELGRMLSDTEANGAAAIAAEKALVKMGAVTALTLFLDGPGAPRALRALGLIGSTDLDSIAKIRACLSAPHAPTRAEAAVALVLCLGEAGVAEVSPLLSDPDKWTRYAVAEALAKLGVTAARPVLEAALSDDEEPWIAGWAEGLLDLLPS